MDTKRNLKLYVAGSWPDREECLALMQRLSGLDYRITQWWPLIEAEATEERDTLALCATGDKVGVLAADVLVACPGWFGTATEVGMALGKGIPVIYYRAPEVREWSVCRDPAWRESIFYHLPNRREVTSFEDLLQELDKVEEGLRIAARPTIQV